jgi:hypothetical protein
MMTPTKTTMTMMLLLTMGLSWELWLQLPVRLLSQLMMTVAWLWQPLPLPRC